MGMKPFIAIVVWLSLASSAWADTYYCLIFAYDSKPIPLPTCCHIWGTFVRLDDDGKLVQEVTLSWHPDIVHPLDRCRPGHNLTLKQTLDCCAKKSIRMWGPFEVNQEFFGKAEAQHLAPGHYKFLDGPFWRHRSQNCIHRLSDLAGPHSTGIYWGWWAANSVYKHYNRQGVIKYTDKDIPKLLELEAYPIMRMQR